MENWCLIVDDNSVNLMIVANMMKHFEIGVDEAMSGAEAIRMAGEKEYDIIFMDYLMPEVDGIETTGEIRKWDNGKKAAVIGLTANLTDDVVSGFMENGANEITSKPMNMGVLYRLMEKWVPYVKKIADEDSKGENAAQEKNLEWLKEKLKEISMDTEYGAFSFSDNAAANYNILSTSVRNLNDALWHLKELKNVTLWQEMRLDFHSLKGILANLGVSSLSQKCGEIEKMAAMGQIEDIKSKAPGLMEELEEFIEAFQNILREWKHEEEIHGNEVRQIGEEEWKETLIKLKECISNFEINDVEIYFQKLYSSANEKDAEILRRANNEMQNFQYERAMVILEEM